MISFKNLLSQIIDEVAHKFGVSKEQVGAIASRDVSSDTGAATGTVLQEILAKIVKPAIITGLDVTATNPPSMNVLVSQGRGTAQGKVHEVLLPQQVTVGNMYSVYYIILDGSRVYAKNAYDSGLAIAKIIIPNINVTNKILDDKNPESDYDGYIISGKDLLFNNDFIIDDESLGQLKNTMSKIFAEYIFGTIKLNESLQIANEQGTLRADSNSVNFYDINGEELASYGAHEARVGNIKVTPSTIQSRDFQENAHGFRLKDNGDAEFDDIVARGTMSSPNFTSGHSGQGWQINRAGDATFNNGYFRGELHTSVFVKDTINATNGNLVVTNATVLASDVATGDTSITVKEAVFSVGDRVRLQPDVSRSEYMSIDSANGTTYGVTRDLDGSGANAFQAGDAVVGQGSRVELVASGDANMPYIDVIKRNSTTWNDTTTKVRLGNLAGITDAQFGTLSGYGLYTNNGYFSGDVRASNVFSSLISGTSIWAPDIRTDRSPNKRITLNNTAGLWAYRTDGTPIFSVNFGAADEGDVVLGAYSTGTGIFWDDSAGILTIKLSAQTRKLSLSPILFNRQSTAMSYTRTESALSGVGGGSEAYHCPVMLPNGAIITSFKVKWQKSVGGTAVTLTLWRNNLDGSSTELGSLTLSTTGSLVTSTYSGPNVGVDNDNYAYSFEYTANPADSGDNILYGVIVTYTITDPLP